MAALSQQFVGREDQQTLLTSAIHPRVCAFAGIHVYGPAGITGKTSLVLDVLVKSGALFAFVDCREVTCIFRAIVSKLIEHNSTLHDQDGTCEEASCGEVTAGGGRGRLRPMEFVRRLKACRHIFDEQSEPRAVYVVIDNIEDANADTFGQLLPLLRVQEALQSPFCPILITASLSFAHQFESFRLLKIPFPRFTLPQLVSIIARNLPGFCQDPASPFFSAHRSLLAYVLAIFTPATRDLRELWLLAKTLLPPFLPLVQPGASEDASGIELPAEARKRLRAACTELSGSVHPTVAREGDSANSVSFFLPRNAKLVLLACVLASFNPPQKDRQMFCVGNTKRRRKTRNGATKAKAASAQVKNRVSGRVLGPLRFPLDRMLAILSSIASEELLGQDRLCSFQQLYSHVNLLLSLNLLSCTSHQKDKLKHAKFVCNISLQDGVELAQSVGLDLTGFVYEPDAC